MLTAINDDLRRNQSSVFFIATNRFLRAFDFLARSKGSNFPRCASIVAFVLPDRGATPKEMAAILGKQASCRRDSWCWDGVDRERSIIRHPSELCRLK
jgi:hypothetical protein